MSMTVSVRENEKLELKAGVDLNGIAETPDADGSI